MFDSLARTAYQIGDFYNTTQNTMAVSLTRLATGTIYNKPSDGDEEYMQIQQIQQDRTGYGVVSNNLSAGSSMLDLAESSGEQIVSSLQRMQELTDTYWAGTSSTSEKDEAQIEYNAIKSSIQDVIAGTTFNGTQLIASGAPVAQIIIDPNNVGNTLNIQFGAGDIVNPAAMDITGGGSQNVAEATMTTQMTNAMNYLADVTGYQKSVESQQSLTSSIVENGSACESAINNVDDGTEMTNEVTTDIRQQAAVSMLAQANAAREGILKLFQ